MGMRVIIAEKPSMGRAIADALGGFSAAASGNFLSNKKDCLITWAIGHLIKVEYPITNNIEQLPMLPKDNEWQLKVIDGLEDQFNLIKRLVELDAVTEVVNACDAGREGEYIGRLIYLKTGTTKPLKRMWINSMTKPELIKAYKGICDADKYEGLNRAAFCRSRMDWCIGINGTIATTHVINRREDLAQNTAIGRVKIPVSMLVVKREREIQNFVPTNFWEIKADFLVNSNGGKYSGTWVNYQELLKKRNNPKNENMLDIESSEDNDNAESESNPFDLEQLEKERSSLYQIESEKETKLIVKECSNKPVTNIVENKKQRKRNPPNLFDLGTIQVLANKLYKINSEKTLEIVQELYEKHQAVTYPRTESQHLPEDYPSECVSILKKLSEAGHIKDISEFAEEAIQGVAEVGKHVFDNKKITDHFAIIPTGVIPKLENIHVKRIYLLIVKRFKEAFLPPMEYMENERFTFIGEHAFRTVGEEIINKGWTAVEEAIIVRTNDEEKKKKIKADVILPTVSSFKDVSVSALKSSKRTRKPPKRYTNGTLLNTMKHISRSLEGDEKKILKSCGIGTPATRAKIIASLFETTDSNGKVKKAMLEERKNSQEIYPTEYGIKVIEFLEENGIDFLTEASLTAKFEMGLNEIVNSPEKSVSFMREVYEIVDDFIGRIKKANQNIPIRSLKGADCPKCQSKMIIEPRYVKCEKCSYSIQRVVANKTLDNEDIESLINHKVTRVIDGFVTDNKKVFSAGIKLETNETGKDVLKFFIPVEKYKDNCPICNSQMEETINLIKCKDKDNCNFTIWKVTYGKKLTQKHIDDLINEGKTKQINDFVSMSNKNMTYHGFLVVNYEEKRVVLDYKNTVREDTLVETKFKCMNKANNCNGLYVLKNGFRYECNTCGKFVLRKQSKQIELSDAQLEKLFKGHHITHIYISFDENNQNKEVREKHDWYINKYGMLRHEKIKS